MKAYRGFIVVIALAVMMWPATAAAQASIGWLPIDVGQKVTITTANGDTVSGRVVTLTPATVEIRDGNTIRNLAVADVMRVQETDSVADGVFKGALLGGLGGLLLGGMADAADAAGQVAGGGIGLLFGVEPKPIKSAGHAGSGAITGIIAGALFGAMIDAGKEKTVFEREAHMSVAVHPIVSNAGSGLGLSVRW